MSDSPQPRIKERGKVIRDPVHGLISINPEEEYLLALIDCPEFQRLRRVRQLGVSSMTYPGAEHTRFAHSLGVMNFAGRILSRLRDRYESHDGIRKLIDNNQQTIKAAALLHDTGHGPFSHMIEHSFAAMADHEARTAQIILDSNSTVNQTLVRYGLSPDAVGSVIDGTFPVWFLRDIVSSQLDADRMDYLLRDSLMSGVEYGNYDAEWIIRALCLGGDPGSRHTHDPEKLRLCLDSSRGLHAAEQLIVARMHMSYQVYYHRVTRGWEAHLLSLFRVAGDLAKAGKLPSSTPTVVAKFLEKDGDLSREDFLVFDESRMLASFHVWSEIRPEDSDLSRLQELASSFLQRQKLFHADELPGANPMENSLRKIIQLRDANAREGYDYYHDEAKFRGYKDFGRSMAKGSEDSNAQTKGSEGIFLSDGDPEKHAIPVEQDPRALITRALENDGGTPLNRVFVHRNFAAKK